MRTGRCYDPLALNVNGMATVGRASLGPRSSAAHPHAEPT